MLRGGHDAYLDGLFESGLSGGETAVGGVGVVALDGVAYVVGENGDVLHLGNVLLKCAAFLDKG